MADSVFKSRTLTNIYDEIKQVYLTDNRPWILGFSGGKDSTCMVQLIWNALSELPREKLHKKIFIISSDTLVESPKVVEQITSTLDMMETASKKSNLPISTNLVRPTLEDSFWVCLLGRGFPAPTNLFRWCTDRLKIRNADRFIQDKVSQYGEAIVVLGTRKDESGSRQQLMNLYEIEGSLLSRHSKFAQTYVYTPLRDFTTEDVWNYLLQNKNPWGANNRDLLAMYQNANASECPLVVDTSTPSCGNSRFGCWVCTVVAEDTSLKNTIESGEDWMEPLLELREELKATQDHEKRKSIRELKRRTGQMKLFDDIKKKAFEKNIQDFKTNDSKKERDPSDPYSILVPGPYTLEFCKEYLEKLLRGQKKVRENGPDQKMNLILEEELHEIQRIWRMERGDWKNSVYQIYEKVMGEKLPMMQEDLSGFGSVEQEVLEDICNKNNVPQLLVSKLLNAEYESQGMSKHSKIFPKLDKILSEEWREDIDEIIQDLKKQKQDKMDLGGQKIDVD
ncbi:DNA phosphorothioation system sulfurtransferase DndC [Nitrosopumilus sp. b1]|uniref:DNA phosphorothioation system sulfurtransferase DndC n=1 Tax=Nitrosopumilus sp. b1 TaxID=2109907 RepID=UPI0015F4D41F|nr:DNA phosphorothioation system sulfurtransferase DndC [Nitrosopumilus sp. b1]KAF6243625.1 DNA phosphorothioation system sulfurtransferase DndC [Nitrosopumilus sp. b1]